VRSKFNARKIAVVQERIKTLVHENVCIAVNATLVVNRIKTDVIANKSPFRNAFRFTEVRNTFNNILALINIPLYNFIVRAMPLPARNAKFRKRGKRGVILRKPNQM
jgi:hypothetical protein